MASSRVRRRVARIVAVAIACSVSHPVLLAQDATSLESAWEATLAQRIGESAAGYAWVVMRNGRILAEGASGYAGIDSAGRRRARMTTTTRMQVASASKPITATALLLALHERGISVDTPAVALLGDSLGPFGDGVPGITVRHLLSHRSGFPFAYLRSPRLENTRALLAAPLPNPSGATPRYSNVNYSLARTILERVTGEQYGAFVQREFLRPAGINGASLRSRPGDAMAHRSTAPVRGSVLDLDFEDEAGAYGWFMTARDLAAWASSLRTGRRLPAGLLDRAFADSLGWGKFTTTEGPAYGHQGQWNIGGGQGVRSGLMLFPDGVVAVILVNTNTPFGTPPLLLAGYARSLQFLSRGP